MKNLQIFSNNEFGEIRTVTIDGNPWFVGRDVTEVLGYVNSRKALLDHVDDEDKYDGVTIRDSIGREQNPVMINESGLYSLILSSKMPNAKRFKHWVASEVIPSVRKNGGYIANQENMTPEQIMAAGLQAAQKIIEEKNRQIQEQEADIQRMRPKEVFADAVTTSRTSILIGQLAKIISQNGVQIGQNRLFAWLRENGYLIIRRGTDYNMPTQRAMEMRLFEIKERTVKES